MGCRVDAALHIEMKRVLQIAVLNYGAQRTVMELHRARLVRIAIAKSAAIPVLGAGVPTLNKLRPSVSHIAINSDLNESEARNIHGSRIQSSAGCESAQAAATRQVYGEAAEPVSAFVMLGADAFNAGRAQTTC